MNADNIEDLPLLTVVVPIYGVELYLRECIESIINQSYKNLEIILIDDGSKGTEGKICDEYAVIDERIRVIHKKNAGLVAARKTGINQASAKYITFVDGDDFIDKEYYANMMEIINIENPDIIAVSYTQYYNNERFETVRQKIDTGVYEGEKLTDLFENINCKDEVFYDFSIFPSACMKIYKTDLLKKNGLDVPEDIKLGEDAAFTFPYILSSEKVVIDNSITGYFYRVVENSMVRERNSKQLIESDILYKYLKLFYQKFDNEKIMKQLELYRIYLLNYSLEWIMDGFDFDSIHKGCRVIKQAANKNGVFDGICVEKYNLPRYIENRFSMICQNNWFLFELMYKKRIVKKIIHGIVKNSVFHGSRLVDR